MSNLNNHDTERSGQLYRCPNGCEVRIRGQSVDIEREVAVDVTCENHEKWMEPVPDGLETQGGSGK